MKNVILSRKELKEIQSLVFKRYCDFGGSFVKGDFRADPKSNSYLDLKWFIEHEFEYIKKRRPDLAKLKGIEARQLKSQLIPSTRMLMTLFYSIDREKAEKEEIGFREDTIDSFVLFMTGEFFYNEWVANKKLDISPVGGPVVFPENPKDRFYGTELIEIFKNVVDEEFMHFIGLFQGSSKDEIQLSLSVDIFREAGVKKFLIGKQPASRSQKLRDIGPKICGEIANLNSRVNEFELQQGRLKRTILDFEQGGLIYLEILDGTYLITANLNQRSMDQFEVSTQKLFEKISAYFGLGFG